MAFSCSHYSPATTLLTGKEACKHDLLLLHLWSTEKFSLVVVHITAGTAAVHIYIYFKDDLKDVKVFDDLIQ